MAAGGHIFLFADPIFFILWSILTIKLCRPTNFGTGNSNMTSVLMCELYISRYHRWRWFKRPSATSCISLYLSLLFLAVFLQLNYVNPLILGQGIQIWHQFLCVSNTFQDITDGIVLNVRPPHLLSRCIYLCYFWLCDPEFLYESEIKHDAFRPLRTSINWN